MLFDTLFREHPHTIRITGIYFLKDHIWTRTLQDKVYNLFHEAKIPLFWIHDINFNIDSWDPALEETAHPVTVDSIDVSTPVYVTLTNYFVKERVIHLLNSYFDTEYNQLLKVTCNPFSDCPKSLHFFFVPWTFNASGLK